MKSHSSVGPGSGVVAARVMLLVPVALGIAACERGWILAKMGVPLGCALILAVTRRPRLPERPDLWALMGAFVFSAAGDWFLSNRHGRESYFLAGIGLFLVAHLGYLGCALAHGRLHRVALVVLLAVFGAYHVGWMAWAISSRALSGAVLGYLVVSCVSMAGALGMRAPPASKVTYVAAIGLVLFSDTLISFSEFLHYRAWNRWILPTYYLAHVLATWAAFGLGPPGRDERRH